MITDIEALSPLSVGNGEFAFTADFTGLQTFPELYKVPLGTQSQWGWHYTGGSSLYTLDDIELQTFSHQGREVRYPLQVGENMDAYHWLRQNPHRLQLGQLSFIFLDENNVVVAVEDVTPMKQTLDLWSGILSSEFSVNSDLVHVSTGVHPTLDQISIQIESALLQAGRLKVSIEFPTQHVISKKWEEAIALNWGEASSHKSTSKQLGEQHFEIERVIDQQSYYVQGQMNKGRITKKGEHRFEISPEPSSKVFSLSVGFAPLATRLPVTYLETIEANKRYWQNFWTEGGFVDFSDCTDERAEELERRVVLSQFLTAVHCAGSSPPQETGLIYNSWFGKFHLEMHWWHSAHFALWGRPLLLSKSFDWYKSILPDAVKLAESQGYRGARWPKMTDREAAQTPSEIAPVLIWQQPHPIALAELCYRAEPVDETLHKYCDIVFATADFMASFVEWDTEKETYNLSSPLIPAQECHNPEDAKNPIFELEYWKYGLELAIKWRRRLGEFIPAKWEEVVAHLEKPISIEGKYPAHEHCLDTFEKYNYDHPSMVGALGVLPGALVDPAIMQRTLEKVKKDWQWGEAWGWDFPMCAMTAARLGDPESAIEFLLMETTKNTYLKSGHNYQSESLYAYLPGNGGLLTAIAMMSAGWRDCGDHSLPGFPKNNKWNVKYEGILPLDD